MKKSPVAQIPLNLLHRVRGLKPWVAIAGALSIGLLGYYAILGGRYWWATVEVDSLSSQISNLSAAQRRNLPPEDGLTAELVSQEKRLEQLHSVFRYQETEAIMATLSSAAQESQVQLMSIVAAEVQPKANGEILYQGQPMTITLKGEEGDIHRFLYLLHQNIPSVSVSGIRLENPGRAPSAQVQLLFYSSPETIPQKDKTK